jgi:hypothetical protein
MPFNNLVKYTQSLVTHSIVHNYAPSTLGNKQIYNHERNHNVMLHNAYDLYNV